MTVTINLKITLTFALAVCDLGFTSSIEKPFLKSQKIERALKTKAIN